MKLAAILGLVLLLAPTSTIRIFYVDVLSKGLIPQVNELCHHCEQDHPEGKHHQEKDRH